MKIDNNPFAKGFRETGQSRCKRKLSTSSKNQTKNVSDEFTHSPYEAEQKRLRVLSPSAFSAGSVEDSELSTYETSSNGSRSPSTIINDDRQSPSCSPIMRPNQYPYALQHYHQMLGANRQLMSLVMPYFNHEHQLSAAPHHFHEHQQQLSPSVNISISCPEQEPQSPKKSNFSIAAILGL